MIEELSREECLARLAAQRLGRLGVVGDGVPLVLPMQFALDAETVVLRSNPGSKMLHVPLQAVSFEVDEVDWDRREGWSVLVQGIGEDISSSIDPRSEALRTLIVQTWAPEPADRWLKIIPQKVTGRIVRVE
jgi:uncharacterized protein